MDTKFTQITDTIIDTAAFEFATKVFGFELNEAPTPELADDYISVVNVFIAGAQEYHDIIMNNTKN